MFLLRLEEKFNAMMAVMRCCEDITWESLAPACTNSKFFKIDVDVTKGDSANGSKTTIAPEKNEIDDINAADIISDGSDEIPVKHFLKKKKSASYRELLNQLKLLSIIQMFLKSVLMTWKCTS